jgi:hypothetical protein
MPRAQKDTLGFEDNTMVKHCANHVTLGFVMLGVFISEEVRHIISPGFFTFFAMYSPSASKVLVECPCFVPSWKHSKTCPFISVVCPLKFDDVRWLGGCCLDWPLSLPRLPFRFACRPRPRPLLYPLVLVLPVSLIPPWLCVVSELMLSLCLCKSNVFGYTPSIETVASS